MFDGPRAKRTVAEIVAGCPHSAKLVAANEALAALKARRDELRAELRRILSLDPGERPGAAALLAMDREEEKLIEAITAGRRELPALRAAYAAILRKALDPAIAVTAAKAVAAASVLQEHLSELADADRALMAAGAEHALSLILPDLAALAARLARLAG